MAYDGVRMAANAVSTTSENASKPTPPCPSNSGGLALPALLALSEAEGSLAEGPPPWPHLAAALPTCSDETGASSRK